MGMVQMFESSHDFHFHASLNMQTQLHKWTQKLGSGSKMTMSTSIPKGHMTNSQHVVAPREVSFELLVLDMCNPSLNHLIINNTRYLLVFDVNGLLCVCCSTFEIYKNMETPCSYNMMWKKVNKPSAKLTSILVVMFFTIWHCNLVVNYIT